MNKSTRKATRLDIIGLACIVGTQLVSCAVGTPVSTQSFEAGDEKDRPDHYPITECGAAPPAGIIELKPDWEVTGDGFSPGDALLVKTAHFPMYSTQDHTSQIWVAASAPKGNIDSIEVSVTQGQMTVCEDASTGTVPIIPCRAEASVCTFNCTYDGSSSEEICNVFVPVAGTSMISYQITANATSGETHTTDAITYSGGTPLDGLVAPVRWHTETPTDTFAQERINLALAPDNDLLGDLEVFASAAALNLALIFANDQQKFASKYYLNRDLFDLWVAPFPGAESGPGADCPREFSNGHENVVSEMNGVAILHDEEFPDCANVDTGGTGSVHVGPTADKPSWILVHESGHFLFGLSDEYGNNAPVPHSEPPNVFYSDTDCSDFLPLLETECSVPLTLGEGCSTFGTDADTWRIVTTGSETMRDRVFTSDFLNTSGCAVDNRLELCRLGTCY